MVNAEPSFVERELTLLSLALLAVKRWKTLLAVGLAAAVVAAVVLWFKPVTYEATGKILVMRTRSSDKAVGLDRTVIEPDYYASVLKSDGVLGVILEKMRLDEAPYRFDIERLRGAAKISPLRNESSIEVTVKLPAMEESTPQKVAQLADAFIEEASRITDELLEKDIQRSMRLFDGEYEKACAQLEKVRGQYQEVFLTAPIEEKTREIENLHMFQRQLQASLAIAIADYEQKKAKLATIEDLLAGEDRLLSVTRALEEEPSLLAVYAARLQGNLRPNFTLRPQRHRW